MIIAIGIVDVVVVMVVVVGVCGGDSGNLWVVIKSTVMVGYDNWV